MGISFVPSPVRAIQALASFQLSAAVKSALELELFIAIKEGHQTAEALATRCQIDPRGARILADYLVMNGFLRKQGTTYGLSEEARYFFDPLSPDYVGGPVAFVQSDFVWEQFGRLTQSVREGGMHGPTHAMAPDHDVWIHFARTMAGQGSEMARQLVLLVRPVLKNCGTGPLKILDVAAGHGMFGITFAKALPACQVVAQDWQRVLEVARENAAAHGVAERISYLPGDVLQVDIGTGYDVVLLPNLMHHLDRATNLRLLKKLRAALKPGGFLAIVEFAPNEDRISPSCAAFALFVLATTPGGDAYTVSEIQAMCAAAGFTGMTPWEMGIQRAIIATNPKL